MKNTQLYKKGLLYNTFCMISRLCTRKHTITQQEPIHAPVVYVSRHQNFYAPLQMMFWFPESLRFWILDNFFERKACLDQYAVHVFHKRMKLPMPIAKLAATPIALVLPIFFHSACSIPVHRGTKAIIRTLKESVKTLESGHSIAIFIDVDYKKTDGEITDIYKGFLYLEKYYTKKTGQHIQFVPLHVSQQNATIHIGKAISFSENRTFEEQKEQIYHEILNALNQLKITQTAEK